MKEVWRKLSNIGIDTHLPYRQARKIRLFNQVSVLTLLITLLFAILNIINGKPIIAGIEFLMVILFAINLKLNQRGKFEVASVIFLVESYLWITALCIFIAPRRDLEYLILLSSVTGLIFYNNRVIILSLYTLCYLLFIGAKISTYGLSDFMAYLNYTMFFVMLYFPVKYLKTEYENYQQLVEDQNGRLLELNEENKKLISIASHDLRSPLIRIQSLLSLLSIEGSLSPEQKEILAMTQREAKLQTQMINEVLKLSALEEGKTTMRSERIEVLPILREIVQSFQGVALRKTITIKTDWSQEIYFCLADKNHLKQVFENLLSNAIKFSYPGSSVYVSIQTKGNHISIAFKDEGQGLDEEDIKKLFIRFQRLSAKPTSGEASTGLGLSIVKKYVDAMNGSIHCESIKGKGATFIVEIPKT